MIKELWDGVSLQQFNNWKPLTGQINEIPVKYKNFYSNVNEWFETFALRAQNDWDAYLDFFLSRWHFQTLKDPNLKQILIDMVFMTIEHWAFNRVPIEFFTNASNTLSNGTTYESNSPSFLNMQGLLPSRAKILANATSLKQLFHSLSEEDLTDEIDLAYFYTKVETDTLLTLQKQEFKNELNLKLNITDALNTSFQRVDNEDNPIGEPINYGFTKKITIKGVNPPEWNPETKELPIDVLREYPVTGSPVVNEPIQNDTIDAISAGYAWSERERINTLLSSITQDIKDRTPITLQEYQNSPYWSYIPVGQSFTWENNSNYTLFFNAQNTPYDKPDRIGSFKKINFDFKDLNGEYNDIINESENNLLFIPQDNNSILNTILSIELVNDDIIFTHSVISIGAKGNDVTLPSSNPLPIKWKIIDTNSPSIRYSQLSEGTTYLFKYNSNPSLTENKKCNALMSTICR